MNTIDQVEVTLRTEFVQSMRKEARELIESQGGVSQAHPEGKATIRKRGDNIWIVVLPEGGKSLYVTFGSAVNVVSRAMEARFNYWLRMQAEASWRGQR